VSETDGSRAPEDTAAEGRDDALPEAREGGLQRHLGKLVASLLFGGGLAWVIARGGLPLVPPREAFSEVSASAIALFCLCLVGAHLLRALRWRYLLEPIGPVPLRSIVAVAWIGFAVILAAPLRSGEIVRPLLITRRGPVGLWEATGTIAAERVVDALVLSLFLVLGLTFVTPQDPLPDHVGELAVPVAAVPSAAALAVVVFTSAFVVMALFYWRRDFARRLVASTVGLVSKRLADTLASVVEKLAQGLRFLPNRRLFVPFVAETMGYWALLSLATFVLMRGVGLPHVTVPEGAVVMGVTGLGILAPAGPGFFGAFQLSAYMALALFHDERALVGAGAAFVFLYYVVQVGFHLLAAVAGLALDHKASVLAASR
jgi:uncharacterized protein (TIRG00374 family)